MVGGAVPGGGGGNAVAGEEKGGGGGEEKSGEKGGLRGARFGSGGRKSGNPTRRIRHGTALRKPAGLGWRLCGSDFRVYGRGDLVIMRP